MDIHFNCPHCRQPLSVDEKGAGVEVPCPSCGKSVAIPKPSQPSKSVGTAAPAAKTPPQPSDGVTSGQAKTIITLLAIGLFVVPFFQSTFSRVAPAQQWEYKIVSVPDYSFDTRMDGYGAEGWEMVFARRASDGSTYSPTMSYEIIFKRPKRL